MDLTADTSLTWLSFSEQLSHSQCENLYTAYIVHCGALNSAGYPGRIKIMSVDGTRSHYKMPRGGTRYGAEGGAPPDFDAMGQFPPPPLSDGVIVSGAPDIR